MTYETALELTGYFASILILVSLLMSSAVKLRIINAVGAAVFTVYGLLIHSYPTAFLNGVSVIVDIYYLVKLLRHHISFSACSVGQEEQGLQEFLRFYRDDMGHCFPGFDFLIEEDDLILMVYANACPVGLMIGRRTHRGGIYVRLDYSVPRYRDCSVGKFLYSTLAESDVTELVTGRSTPEHEAYLKKMGFSPSESGFIKKFR